jgi:hypothetical protein
MLAQMVMLLLVVTLQLLVLPLLEILVLILMGGGILLPLLSFWNKAGMHHI